MTNLRDLTLAIATAAFLTGTVGCSGSTDEGGDGDGDSGGSQQTSTQLCQADCDRVEAECPADSLSAQLIELCDFGCLAYDNSDECSAQYQDYSDCLSMHAVDCDGGSLPSDCETLQEPFSIQIDFESGETTGGACVNL